MKSPRRQTIAAWTGLATVSRVLLEAVEAELKAADLPPLCWYDALLEIEKAGGGGLRPYELKDRLLLPQYGTSRLVGRMEEAGLIDRHACAEDGRGQVLKLTAEGRAMRRRMWPVYAGVLRERIERRIDADEAAVLSKLLAKLNDNRSG